ncbi:MAG: GNAT family N-acetyltransferase [Acidobacteria bacterium]|nr:GNAT family N-acetyltransferase [Acidobacteriota bacterium]
MVIETERLVMRRWVPDDLVPFAAINADPEVMRYYPSPLTRDQTKDLMDRMQSHFERHGFGLWALETQMDHAFVGFTGLMVPRFEAHFTPCVEIGWRVARAHWGRGLATEAALAAAEYGFQTLALKEILAFTTPANTASRRVMEKIGMTYEFDFDHPLIEKGHPLKRHVLYRLPAPESAGG